MSDATIATNKPGTKRAGRILLHAFLITMALIWLVPIFGALYSSFRPYSDTQNNGVFSMPDTLTLENYRTAWEAVTRACGATSRTRCSSSCRRW
jgi:multiple sugar transport system permease protein